ncbi:MAG TPA: alpha/beta hydrolase, partial [Spirochaetota bacterium]|nr:alpha/beta hydrolase [Spirochaetota bacterium]
NIYYGELCSTLASRGYTVMMLVRRGYGNSEGADSELKDTPYDSGMEATKDILSAVTYMKTNPYVNPDKIVVMGQSQGGWDAIAFSTLKDTGVLGTVNISGGVNYTDILADPLSTRYSKWIADCGKYGAINEMPTLWIYSPNDKAIPDIASQPMFQSFQDAGGKGTFIMKPPFGDNGHYLVGTPDFYIRDIMAFFNQIGFTDTN